MATEATGNLTRSTAISPSRATCPTPSSPFRSSGRIRWPTRHMRDSAARFHQVIDVSDADRALAFANIQKAGVLRREPVGDRLVSVPARTRLVPRLVLCSQHAKLRLSWGLTALRRSCRR